MFSPLLARAQADWPPQTQISGFPFWDEQAGGTEMCGELVEFLAAGPAPVVFTLGSSAVLNPGTFYTESVDAVGKLGVRAVVPDGEGGSGTRIGRNILRLPSAPHSYVFQRASVIVHSEGIGTCARAMRAGRPMLIVPFAYAQPDNASRLVRLGVARMIGRNSYTAARAVKEIGSLLANSSYRSEAEGSSRVLEQEDGAGTACDALERCLSGSC